MENLMTTAEELNNTSLIACSYLKAYEDFLYGDAEENDSWSFSQKLQSQVLKD